MLRVEEFSSLTPKKSKTSIIFVPGILADGTASIAGIDRNTAADTNVLGFLRQNFGKVTTVSYPKHDWSIDEIETQLATIIENEINNDDVDHVVMLMASMGAMVGADALALSGSWERTHRKVRTVFIDSPITNTNLGMGGNFVAPILRTLRVGEWPFIKNLPAPYGPPKREEVQQGIDFEELNAQVKANMSNFNFGTYSNQLAFMSAWYPMDAYDPYSMLPSAYIMCTVGNTVRQPRAMKDWLEWHVGATLVVQIDSPHCGFTQLPQLWIGAIEEAINFVLEVEAK